MINDQLVIQNFLHEFKEHLLRNLKERINQVTNKSLNYLKLTKYL